MNCNSVNPTIVCSCTAEGMYTSLDAQVQMLAFSTGYIKEHKSMRTRQNPILHEANQTITLIMPCRSSRYGQKNQTVDCLY